MQISEHFKSIINVASEERIVWKKSISKLSNIWNEIDFLQLSCMHISVLANKFQFRLWKANDLKAEQSETHRRILKTFFPNRVCCVSDHFIVLWISKAFSFSFSFLYSDTFFYSRSSSECAMYIVQHESQLGFILYRFFHKIGERTKAVTLTYRKRFSRLPLHVMSSKKKGSRTLLCRK